MRDLPPSQADACKPAGLATAAWKALGSPATGIHGFWRYINSHVSCKWQYVWAISWAWLLPPLISTDDFQDAPEINFWIFMFQMCMTKCCGGSSITPTSPALSNCLDCESPLGASSPASTSTTADKAELATVITFRCCLDANIVSASLAESKTCHTCALTVSFC